MHAGDHNCPGGCGAPVRWSAFSCRVCWRRLPAGLQAGIVDSSGVSAVAHTRAVTAAQLWFAVHR